MRISETESNFIVHRILELLPEAKVYLFGSRVDDQEKGGDVDIIIVGKRKLTIKEKLKIKRAFWNEFGEQKLDLISTTEKEESPFKNIALDNAILLS